MSATTKTKDRSHRPAVSRGSRKASGSDLGPSPEEKLVADLIALIEQGTAPWRREWQWSYPNSVDRYQGFTVVSVRVAMNCCS